jgi:hypothetical protein
MRTPSLDAALPAAAREAARAARRHGTPAAEALRDTLERHAAAGGAPDAAWIAGAIRDAAVWATDDADVPLLAALGALARAVAAEA